MVLAAVGVLAALSIGSAFAQTSDSKMAGKSMPGKMTNQQMMDKMDKMSVDEKAAMFDKMTANRLFSRRSPKSAEAHLQLGNLYSDQTKFTQAIPEYETARKLDPDLADVRYRLGQAYVRTGKKDLAQEEFAVYQKLREQHLADLDKQRAEIRQFVYSAKDAGAKPE